MPAERLPLFSGKWISEDEARGEARGEAKGRKEGEIKGRVAMLHRLLVKRFGENTIDLCLQDRLMSSSPEQLDTWAERILDAKTIDDVFSDNA
jgi:predicted transposase YdaD